jgi:CheY-like chemotaxis protein
MKITKRTWPILIVSRQFDAPTDEGQRLRALEEELDQVQLCSVLTSQSYEDAAEIVASRADLGAIVIDWDIQKEDADELMAPDALLDEIRHRNRSIPVILLSARQDFENVFPGYESAIIGVDYLSVFFPALDHPVYSGITSIAIIWIFTGINILGAAWIGRLVSVGVVLLLIPVILTGTLGWFFFDPALFRSNWIVGTQTPGSAVMAAVILCIWSFIGIESASVNTAVVDNPRRTIPLSTMIGAVLAGLVYILSCTAISGMFPAAQMAASGAPFSLAMERICAGMPFAHLVSDAVSAVTAFAPAWPLWVPG